MTIRPSEIQITKLSDATTPLLFSEDAFVATDVGPDTPVTLDRGFVKSWSTSSETTEGAPPVSTPGPDDLAVDPNNPNVDPSDPSIGLFPTETIFPTEIVFRPKRSG